MRAINGFSGSFVTKCALQLAPLVFVRPGELRHAEWAEIDLEWLADRSRLRDDKSSQNTNIRQNPACAAQAGAWT